MTHHGRPVVARFAAIDVGSNSVKLRISARSRSAEGWDWSLVHEVIAITGLGRGLATNSRLDPAAAAATLGVLRLFVRTIADHDCAGVAAVGTQCLREAEDGPSFAATARKETGLPLEIISGQDEARLAYSGACSELPRDIADARLAAFDAGGRSTEFGFGWRDRLEQSASLIIGVLDLTERYLSEERPAAVAVASAYADVARLLANLPAGDETPALVGIGGTPASLGAVQLGRPIADAAAVHGLRVTRAEVSRQIELYRRSTLAQRRRLPGLHPDRANVILAGAVVVAATMDRLGCEHLRIGVHGLRQGLLRDRFERADS